MALRPPPSQTSCKGKKCVRQSKSTLLHKDKGLETIGRILGVEDNGKWLDRVWFYVESDSLLTTDEIVEHQEVLGYTIKKHGFNFPDAACPFPVPRSKRKWKYVWSCYKEGTPR